MLAALLLAAGGSMTPAVAHRVVATTVASAQRAFDRGLTDLYAYADGSASTAFYEARNADPHLAMASWGDALAEGSDLNTPLTELRFGRAHDASLRAQAVRAFAGARDAALIDAVAARYAGSYDERWAGERAYVRAMEADVKAYPDDDDAAMLLVEALLEDRGMQWNADGSPLGEASAEMLRLTSAVLARNPQHLFANHLCLHLYDNAPNRDAAVPCAQRLDALALAPQDEHLAHMPAHLWIERGDWRAALASSERAYALVASWAAATGQDLTAAKYLRHDETVAFSAARFGGDVDAAARWAERLNRFVPRGYDARSGPHLALGSAFDALRRDDVASAQTALAMLRRAGLVQDAALLEARIDEAQEKPDAAIASLARAATWQRQNLPPETIAVFPATERIGAVQFRARRYADAERTFRAALDEHPEEPRALFGLWQTLLARGNTEEAAAFETRFRAAWAGQYALTIDDF